MVDFKELTFFYSSFIWFKFYCCIRMSQPVTTKAKLVAKSLKNKQSPPSKKGSKAAVPESSSEDDDSSDSDEEVSGPTFHMVQLSIASFAQGVCNVAFR